MTPTRPLRVLIVADGYPPDNRGGAAGGTRLVADALRQAGHKVLVLTHGRARRNAPAEQVAPRLAASLWRALRGTHPARSAAVVRIAAGPVGFMAALPCRGAAIARRFAPDVIEFSGPVGPLLLLGLKLRPGRVPPSVGVIRGVVHKERAMLAAGCWMLDDGRRMPREPGRGPQSRSVAIGDPRPRPRSGADSGCRVLDDGRRVPASRRPGVWASGRSGVSASRLDRLRAAVMLALEPLRANLCTRIAGVSRAAIADWSRRFGKRHKLAVLPNGVETERWRPDRSAANRLRGELGLADAQIVLFAGSFRPVKGIDVLLEAFVRLIRRCPRAVLLAAGRDPPETIRPLIDRLGLGDRVRLPGWLDAPALADHFNLADLVVVPSRYETFGFTAAEAMACGAAVVASAVGGLVELIDPPATGRLVRPADPSALADAIAGLLSDPAARAALGRAARQRILARFTLDQMVSARVSLYRQLLE